MLKSQLNVSYQRNLKLLANGYEPIPELERSKATYIEGWPTAEITPEWLAEQLDQHPDHTNIGLRCGELITVDIDLYDPDDVNALRNVCSRFTVDGQTLLPRNQGERHGSKGCALLFRLRPGCEPRGKITIKGSSPRDGEVKVEILGAGCKISAFGPHPDTGREYEWTRRNPLQNLFTRHPILTATQIEKLAHALSREMEDRGFSEVRITGRGMLPEHVVEAQTNGEPVTAQMVERWLSIVSNDPAIHWDRELWRNIGFAIASARAVHPSDHPHAGEPDLDWDALETFRRFSRGEFNEEGMEPGRYTDDEAADAIIASARPKSRSNQIGIGTLIDLARKSAARSGENVGPTVGPARAEVLFEGVEAPGRLDQALNHDQAQFEEARADLEEAQRDYLARMGLLVNRGEKPRFPLLRIGQVLSQPDQEYLVPTLAPEGGTGIIFGEAGALKSFLVLDQALSFAVGKAWGEGEGTGLEGFHPLRPLRVVYVAGEGELGLKRRIAGWLRAHKVELEKMGVEIDDDLPLLIAPIAVLPHDEASRTLFVESVRKAFDGAEPDVIVIDTMMKAAQGLNIVLPHDSETFWNAGIKVMQRMFGGRCFINVVHHTGKDTDRGALGAYNHRAFVDVMWMVEVKDSGPGWRVIKLSPIKFREDDNKEIGSIYMRAQNVTAYVDGQGNVRKTLALRRIEGVKYEPNAGRTANQHIISAAKTILQDSHREGRADFTAKALADEVVNRCCPNLSDGEQVTEKTRVRELLGKLAKGGELSRYANKQDPNNPRSPWTFGWVDEPVEGENAA